MTGRPLESKSSVEARREMSGLDFFRAMLAGRVPAPALATLLGFELTEVEEGRIVFTGDPNEPFYNGMGVVHGGWAAAMLDSALGCAINSTMPAGRSFTTLELKVNFTRPLRREVGRVRCEAHIVYRGRRTATAEGRIVDANGKVYAHGTTTCIVVERGTPTEGSAM